MYMYTQHSFFITSVPKELKSFKIFRGNMVPTSLENHITGQYHSKSLVTLTETLVTVLK